AATSPESREEDDHSRLDALMDRIHQLTVAQATPVTPPSELLAEPIVPCGAEAAGGEWMPIESETLPAAGLTDSEVEALILKSLNGGAEATGRSLSDHLKLAFRIIDPLMHSMKQDRLVAHKNSAPMNDYVYQLTEPGAERAKKIWEHCTEFGAQRDA